MTESLLEQAKRLHDAGRLSEAGQAYLEALRRDPRQPEALLGLGNLSLQTGRYAEAEQLIGQALRLDPRLAEAQFALGCVLQRTNRIADALAAFDRTLKDRPEYVDALVNRGAASMALGRPADALKDFERAVAINPSFAGAWSNCGCVLYKLNRHEEALRCFDRALALSPDLVEALVNRAAVLPRLRHFTEAAEACEKLLEIRPDHPYTRGDLAYFRLRTCDWQRLEEDRAEISRKLQQGQRVIQPHSLVLLSSSPEEQLQCAHIAAGAWPASQSQLWRGETYRHDKIRVAYISADFRDHATSWLAAGFFEQHDRSRFKTIGVSLLKDEASEMRPRMRNAFDEFIDVDRKSDAETAALLREKEVDIAVDLMGFASGHRLGIFALRPAPVQVNYLGYPGTMGAPYFDYIIADKVVIPDEHRAFYSEKIVILPDTYQCNDSEQATREKGPSRAEAGLPLRGFVFGCFNDGRKIAPEHFDFWMRLLSEVKESVLWLIEDNPDATLNLRREAKARGIPPSRLVFAPRVGHADHLARHALADVFLDTLPCGAHTTASDALWAGTPVLTVLGSSFAGRVAASLLTAIGLPELISRTREEHFMLALKLARDKEALAALKARLARNRETYPLFDTERFTRKFEAALTLMHGRQRNGEPPAHLSVAS